MKKKVVDPKTLRIYKSPCKNCLFTKNRIVSPRAADEYIQKNRKQHTAFECHISSMSDDPEQNNVCCYNYWKEYQDKSLLFALARSLNVIRFQPMPRHKKKRTWEEQQSA